MSLFWRVVTINGAVLLVAALMLVFSPATVSSTVVGAEVVVLAAGLLVVMGVNFVLLRRVFGPLERLAGLMRRVDPMSPGRRIDVDGAGGEVGDLLDAFNEMLDRLERERRESARVALAAQERERRRVASELHDEIGQSLTAAAIQIERAADAPDPAKDLGGVADAVRSSLDEVRRIARELRPEALDDLGLINALIALCSRAAVQGRLSVERRLAAIPPRSSELDLVIYRVAQESLTNVVRHAQASSAVVTLGPVDGNAVLTVADDGRGLPPQLPDDTAGISGMRERARLVNAELRIESTPGSGTTVQLEAPIERPDADSA